MADDPKPKLTPDQKNRWNRFVDYVATQKMAGHPSLDQRNKQVGMKLLQSFNMANPDAALPVDVVPIVQQELNDYRNESLQKIKTGKAVFDGKEEDFMPGLSQVDGWPGTKTLSSRFPVATATSTNQTGTKVKDYGTDTEKYDRERGLAKNK